MPALVTPSVLSAAQGAPVMRTCHVLIANPEHVCTPGFFVMCTLPHKEHICEVHIITQQRTLPGSQCNHQLHPKQPEARARCTAMACHAVQPWHAMPWLYSVHVRRELSIDISRMEYIIRSAGSAGVPCRAAPARRQHSAARGASSAAGPQGHTRDLARKRLWSPCRVIRKPHWRYIMPSLSHRIYAPDEKFVKQQRMHTSARPCRPAPHPHSAALL